MAGAFAASLGAIAMVTVILRGAFSGEAAADCIFSSIGSLLGFAAMGWVAGTIMDSLVRQDMEQQYRGRLERFRQESKALHGEHTGAGLEKRQDAG